MAGFPYLSVTARFTIQTDIQLRINGGAFEVSGRFPVIQGVWSPGWPESSVLGAPCLDTAHLLLVK
jgi:hypothetical protein